MKRFPTMRAAVALLFGLGLGVVACSKGDPAKAKKCTEAKELNASSCEACCKDAGYGGFAWGATMDGAGKCECG